MTRPAILLLAAGASTRMRGRDKLLEEVSGQPLLAERVASARATGARVIVALPPRGEAPARWDALSDSGAHLVAVDRAAEGMAASIAAGIAVLPKAAPGVMVVLADMPDITTADMLLLLDRFDGEAILRGASAGGAPGHPVLFPARDFPALRHLKGDQGARKLLAREAQRVVLVPLPGSHALTDLDTPEDWASWRKPHGGG